MMVVIPIIFEDAILLAMYIHSNYLHTVAHRDLYRYCITVSSRISGIGSAHDK